MFISYSFEFKNNSTVGRILTYIVKKRQYKSIIKVPQRKKKKIIWSKMDNCDYVMQVDCSELEFEMF